MPNIFASVTGQSQRKAPAKKKTPVKPKTPSPEDRAGRYHLPETEDEKDLARLIQKSTRAKLEEQILKNEQIRYKNEQEKIKLLKGAGELIEYSLADFLFIGYMEKASSDLLGMMKRLEPIIINLVKEGDCKGIIKRVNKDIKAILIEVKKSQAEDVRKWRRDL